MASLAGMLQERGFRVTGSDAAAYPPMSDFLAALGIAVQPFAERNLEPAPDVIVGYADGYRASWDAAVGKVSPRVFEDNRKAWSGDHCVDPHLVPGVVLGAAVGGAALAVAPSKFSK